MSFENRRQARVDETIYEEKIPPIPTREQELEYLDFLESSIRSDPIFSFRYKRYRAGP